MPPRTLVSKSISISASPSQVWKALTNPELLNHWMSDGEIRVLSDWKEGSPVLISGKVNGDHAYKGRVLYVLPEKILRYSSWTSISNLPDKDENYSLVEFTLRPEENQTTLSVTHSNLIAEAAYEHANFYWASALVALKKLVEA